YIEVAQGRINSVERLLTALQDEPPKPERVPFKEIIERGLLKAGDILYIGMARTEAEVLPEGLLRLNGFIGSIHRVGAQALGLPACNGWEHWKYLGQKSGEYRQIDELRKAARKLRSASTSCDGTVTTSSPKSAV